MSTEPEASLKMVALGAGFVAAPFIGQNIGEDQKKKRTLLQNELVFSPKAAYVMTKKKKGLCLPISGFSVSKEKNKNKSKWCHPKMVTPGAGRPSPHSDATGQSDN